MFGLFGFKTNRMPMNQAKEEWERDRTVQIIDVRTEEEYRSGHIPGSRNIPLHTIGPDNKKLKDKDKRMFIYCYSGSRSWQACRRLKKLGFADVTNIGGITAWNGPLARGNKAYAN
ncbi:rhodanese-like domain-containing protein [Papillibacter cinnamivorans]|uniref:Rhodanese-related sulfurtransferase n=1 Tax=Papillibacter cinnamivorans DSM 12816 TaxID=1122930 RepID=A0A1W2BV20_9FIRM|nr:rhodanese-like domain-containing protein [Papillibacter cinnamivorans]SMC76452.1 Rhodanese-related sulfurtransferase [Papillibacter cinnamivorans DSM 12816]